MMDEIKEYLNLKIFEYQKPLDYVYNFLKPIIYLWSRQILKKFEDHMRKVLDRLDIR